MLWSAAVKATEACLAAQASALRSWLLLARNRAYRYWCGGQTACNQQQPSPAAAPGWASAVRVHVPVAQCASATSRTPLFRPHPACGRFPPQQLTNSKPTGSDILIEEAHSAATTSSSEQRPIHSSTPPLRIASASATSHQKGWRLGGQRSAPASVVG